MTATKPHGLAGQLPLQLMLDQSATLENFSPGPAAAALCATLKDYREPLHFLHGAPETGKSHLLQAACGGERHAALYLPLAALREEDPDALFQDLEHSDRIALDDLDSIAADTRWEEALFHLVNRCRASACQLLLAARRPPLELGVKLADLRSRLAGGLVWALPAQDDEDRRRILALRAAQRGLSLSPQVLDYLCRRASRSLVDLLALLERLDEASLRAQRPITVPLLREVMAAAP